MTTDSNNEDILYAATEEGKEISINIKIQDSDKAKRLMATMHDKNVDELGVIVQSWGFWDIQKANRLRIEAMNREIDRHQLEMQSLALKPDLVYLAE